MMRLSAVRSRKAAVSDYLPWAAIVDGGGSRGSVVQTKRGAFLAGWYFTPPDNASSTDEFASYVAERCNDAMLMLGTGWSSWTDAISIPAAPYPAASESSFPDPISRMVDEERRAAYDSEGAHWENERVFCLCYHPPSKATSHIERMFYDDDTKTDASGMMTTMLNGFARACHEFESALETTIGMRRMRSFVVVEPDGREQTQDELLNYLNFCATGDTNGVAVPSCGAYLDTLLGSQEMDPGEVPFLGDSWLMAVAISGFPAESYANVLESLSTLPVAYRFTQRMIFLDAHDAEVMLAAYRRAWSGRVVPFVQTVLGLKNPTINTHALGMKNDTERALALNSSGTVRFGYYTPVLLVRGPDAAALRKLCHDIVTAVKDCGYNARIETANTVEAWRGSLPGDIHSNVRRPPFHTNALSTLLPLSGIWTGQPFAPCPQYPQGAPPLMFGRTIGSIPFRANLHVGDVGHTLIFGPTGAGKSALLNSIQMQALRYQNMRITVFDNKRGALATISALGGKYYELGGTTSPQICPLRALETPVDRSHAHEWISICYQLQTQEPADPKQNTEIHRAIETLASGHHRSISDFMLACQDDRVRDAMRFYTVDGPVGRLTDGHDDGVEDHRCMAFETLDLLEMQERVSLPVLLSLFRRFERRLDGSPSLLVIDEGWVVLGNSTWRDKLSQWLRLLRSKNCSVVFATQSLSEAVKSGIFSLLMEACPTKIFLPNAQAQMRGTDSEPGPRDLYEMFGLNDNQIEIIRRAIPKRHYYWTSPEGRRLIDLGLGPVQLAFAGATGEKDVVNVIDMIGQHGDEWPLRWLEAKGVSYAHLL